MAIRELRDPKFEGFIDPNVRYVTRFKLNDKILLSYYHENDSYRPVIVIAGFLIHDLGNEVVTVETIPSEHQEEIKTIVRKSFRNIYPSFVFL